MYRVVFPFVLSAVAIGFAALVWPRVRTRRWLVPLAVIGALWSLSWAASPRLGHALAAAFPQTVRSLRLAGAAWFGACVLIFDLSVLFLLALGIVWAFGKAMTAFSRRQEEAEKIDLSRRKLLLTLGKGIPAAAALTSVTGLVGADMPVKLKRLTIRLRDLPAGLDGFRIGQITDTHAGPFVTSADIAHAVRMLDEAGVDLQVMTGDLCDDVLMLPEVMAGLGTCQARHGLLAIFGNHEHYRGIGHFTQAYKDIGAPVRLLVNENVVLRHEGARLRVVGVDYPLSVPNRKQQMEAFAEQAFAGVQPGETTVCLAHYPDFFPYAAARKVQLTLSGHTHGGQIAIIGAALARLVLQYVKGWYRDGDSQLYVSNGTGHWLPIRIGVPAEVTVLTLRRA